MANRLNPNGRLLPGTSISSDDGRFSLVMQGDGNLVLYRNGAGALWATGTAGKQVAFAVMQNDGNLVLYTPNGAPVWASGTHGNPGSVLILQDDGNLVIYAPGSRTIWASNTREPDQRIASVSRDEMEFTVKVSRTGIVETERYAGIKKQSGTYYHHFWFSIQDAKEDTIWAMTAPLTLTIGAATTAWGKPSFVSKRERAVFNIPADKAQAMASIAFFLQRTKAGSGSLLDQLDEAARIYKRLKNNDLVKDAVTLVTEFAAG